MLVRLQMLLTIRWNLLLIMLPQMVNSSLPGAIINPLVNAAGTLAPHNESNTRQSLYRSCRGRGTEITKSRQRTYNFII